MNSSGRQQYKQKNKSYNNNFCLLLSGFGAICNGREEAAFVAGSWPGAAEKGDFITFIEMFLGGGPRAETKALIEYFREHPAQSAPRAASLHLVGHLRANSSPKSKETARAAPLCTPPPRCAAPAVAEALSPAGTMKCERGRAWPTAMATALCGVTAAVPISAADRQSSSHVEVRPRSTNQGRHSNHHPISIAIM
jgi:hypothetical protein